MASLLSELTKEVSSRTRVAILLPEPHLETGGNYTLVEFLTAASERHHVQVFFVRHSNSKSDRKLVQAEIRRMANRHIRVTWLSRLLDSNLAKGVTWTAILRREVRWTSLRFLMDPRRYLARRSMRKVGLLLTSQYLTAEGVKSFRRLSNGKLVLNLAGHPEWLRENFLRSRTRSSLPGSTQRYSNFLRTIDHFLLQTEQHRRVLIEMEPWIKPRTTVIRPSVDVEKLTFEPLGLKKDFCPYESERKVILNVGKLGLKGQDLALAAFEGLAPLNPAWDLHFVGSLDSKPSFSEDLKNHVAFLGLENRVRFWGHREDLGYFLKCADLLLLSSEYEGAPRVLREAMFLKLPVVTVPIAGVTELVSQQSAYVALSRDKESLAVALAHAISSPDLRRKRAENAKRDFDLNMSPDVYRENVLGFVDGVLQSAQNS